MNNKSKYNLFKNTKYAIDGFNEILSNEVSFKTELLLLLVLSSIFFIFDFTVFETIIMIGVGFLVLVIEAINSSIERVVDLCTKEIHPLAKQAKDIGSFAVMLSIIFFVFTWSLIIFTKLN